MKRLHGSHNKKVCDILHLQDGYTCNDWVVTTSFYASIHYLDHALFPCTYKDKELKDINEAHRHLRGLSKHQTREILLNRVLPKHKGDYSFLISESQNARYVDYNVNDAIANKAVRLLESIITSYDKDREDIK